MLRRIWSNTRLDTERADIVWLLLVVCSDVKSLHGMKSCMLRIVEGRRSTIPTGASVELAWKMVMVRSNGRRWWRARMVGWKETLSVWTAHNLFLGAVVTVFVSV